jgi:hypothetical protein
LITRQSEKRGRTSSDSFDWMKARLSIGANRPDRSRSAAMTSESSRPMAAVRASALGDRHRVDIAAGDVDPQFRAGRHAGYRQDQHRQKDKAK